MQKLDKDEQSYDKMKCKQDSQVERHTQHLTLKTVERMISGFSPEQKCQHQIADLNNYDQTDELFNPRIILDNIYFWKQHTQEMLYTLSQVQDAKIQVEAHTARFANENPAKQKRGGRECEIKYKEGLMYTLYPQFVDLVRCGYPHRYINKLNRYLQINHKIHNKIKIIIIIALIHPQTLHSLFLRRSSFLAFIIFFIFLFFKLALLLLFDDLSSDLQSEYALSYSSLSFIFILSVIKSSRLYSSSQSIIFIIALKHLQLLFLVTHFLLCSFMKSKCECQLDSQIQSVLSYKLKRPIEQMKRRVNPKEYRSNLKGSKYLSLGCLIFLKNQGELYSTVVSSAVGFSFQLISIQSSKSQSRYVPL